MLQPSVVRTFLAGGLPLSMPDLWLTGDHVQANSTYRPFGVGTWVVIRVITGITGVETIKNGRPGLRTAVRHRPKFVGAGLAYGLLAICPLCLWRTAPLQLQFPLVALCMCCAFQLMYASVLWQDFSRKCKQNNDKSFAALSFGRTLFVGQSVRQREEIAARAFDICIIVEGDCLSPDCLCETFLKATKQVNGKGQNSTPRHTKTP